MVFNKIKNKLSGNDEKYEVLYYKYSQIKLQNKKLKIQHEEDLKNYKAKTHFKLAKHIINLYSSVETAKASSFKIKVSNPDFQKLLIDINKVEKEAKTAMLDFSIEEINAKERFYDPELHEIASYQDAKGMAKGLIIKTVKKGFKYKGKIIYRPRVVVTK